jgi:hypothetical protein
MLEVFFIIPSNFFHCGCQQGLDPGNGSMGFVGRPEILSFLTGDNPQYYLPQNSMQLRRGCVTFGPSKKRQDADTYINLRWCLFFTILRDISKMSNILVKL